MSFLSQNLAVIERRWPQLHESLCTTATNNLDVAYENNTVVINNIQLTSNYDRLSEAKLLVEQVDDNHSPVFVFGLGLGDHINRLIEVYPQREIKVCITNFKTASVSLSAVEHPWITHQNVQLLNANVVKQIPDDFVALVSELILADAENEQLRDNIFAELDERSKDKLTYEKNFNNLVALNEFNMLESGDFTALLSKYSGNQKAYIAAAGPSLEEHLYWLEKEQDNILLIAVDTAVPALIARNIVPDIIVMIDQHTHLFLENVDKGKMHRASLVYFPTANNNFVEQWSGDKYCAYGNTRDYNVVNASNPKPRLFSAGSVIHPTVDLAAQFGAKEIVLLGTDFSFINDKSHAAMPINIYTDDEIANTNHWIENGMGTKNRTLANYRTYLRELEKYIAKKSHIRFFNGSEQSAKIEGATLWNHS
ncbi:motility associated factor glycosyltransferase family protein [Thalassotalea euphylliae]|uniref:motility associated factor glycosyltransferase family protein n=1 Tax=Thalassotalea euphylliae TaxID=1655234 RepID=UPI00363E1D07